MSQSKQPTSTPSVPASTVRPAQNEAPPMTPAKAPPVSIGTTGAVGGAGKPSTELVKPTDTSKVQSTAVSSSKSEPSKVTSTVTKPTATTVISGTTSQKDDVKSKDTKVKSDLSAKTSTTEKKMPAGQPEKPKEVSKPLTIDDAVDSLSAGFVSSPPPEASKPQVKHEIVAPANTSKNYAPPPTAQKKQDVSVPSSLSPAPPADKKPKIEKPAASAAAQDVKPKTEEKKVSADKLKQDPKAEPKSPDPFDALSGTLPQAKPVPESPKLRPEEIVDEKKLKSEKGVLVGERDDTLPPEYRHLLEKDSKKPPPPKQPSMGTTEALDILSGDFTDASVAHSAHSPAPPKTQAKQAKVEDLSAIDALSGDFVAPSKGKQVCSGAPSVPTSATKSATPSKSEQVDPLALDALDMLGDTLPTAKPVPESPKLRPEEIVKEDNLKAEKGVRVGEREDTLPPEYRLPKTDPKTQPPPPKKEPSLDPSDALDILSGDFTSSAAAPVVQACLPPSAPPATSSGDFDLEDLDFVAPTSASKVSSASSAPTTTDRQLSEGSSSAMDALSDTLKDIRPATEPAPVSPKDIVKEKEVVEERVGKPGETDDSLPPEYRPTEADKKAAAEAKAKAAVKKPSIDEDKALDALSSDFVSGVPGTSPAPQCQAPPVNTSSSKPESAPVMDQLASSLLPEGFPTKKQSDTKPKGKGRKSKSASKKTATADAPAMDTPHAPSSTGIVPSSTTKKGGKS